MLCVRQTWKPPLILAISLLRGYLAFIRKDSSNHMQGLTVYVKEGLSFAWDISLENLLLLTYIFDWLYFTWCLTSFSSIDQLLRLCTWFLILLHLT